ncbi:hypothetical protein HDR66_02820 [bacterium]|nr:hypothetical protein [bacterium]
MIQLEQMTKQIDRILICVLWILAATLGGCFWMRSLYGFNLMSGQHWQYLSYMQANQMSVRTSFYISLCAIILAVVVGLYMLVRPRGLYRRKKNIHTIKAQIPGLDAITDPMTAKAAQPTTPQETIQQTAGETPEPTVASHPAPPAPQRPSSPNMMRPRGPNGGMSTRTTTAATAQPTTAAPSPQFVAPQPAPRTVTSSSDFDRITEIFAAAGYVIKPNPQINNFKPALTAIGTGDVLWMGGVGIPDKKLQDAIDQMNRVFTETLDSIVINVFGFIVAPTDRDNNDAILKFDTPEQLNEYMSAHPNPTPPDDEVENFDAYSEYMDTVIKYMGKI